MHQGPDAIHEQGSQGLPSRNGKCCPPSYHSMTLLEATIRGKVWGSLKGVPCSQCPSQLDHILNTFKIKTGGSQIVRAWHRTYTDSGLTKSNSRPLLDILRFACYSATLYSAQGEAPFLSSIRNFPHLLGNPYACSPLTWREFWKWQEWQKLYFSHTIIRVKQWKVCEMPKLKEKCRYNFIY